jgi:histone H3/H4
VLFGRGQSVVFKIVRYHPSPATAKAAESIVERTLAVVEQGAGGLTLDLSAKLSFRAQFIPRILQALEDPDWQSLWARERPYVFAYAKAIGDRAAEWAALDRRKFITADDIDAAMTKLRGYLPVAGRWCPL